jgi:cytochrome c
VRLAALLLVLLAAGCGGGTTASPSPHTGDAARGGRMIAEFGCGTCHVVPGVRGADGDVGPSLAGFAHRRFIAGEIPNTERNLVRWIVNPPAIEPKTGMPNMNVPPAAAADIAAFLRGR